jgi:hypothetical protein
VARSRYPGSWACANNGSARLVVFADQLGEPGTTSAAGNTDAEIAENARDIKRDDTLGEQEDERSDKQNSDCRQRGEAPANAVGHAAEKQKRGDVRVRPESSGTGQAPEHDLDHGEADQGDGGPGEVFEVAGEASVALTIATRQQPALRAASCTRGP